MSANDLSSNVDFFLFALKTVSKVRDYDLNRLVANSTELSAHNLSDFNERIAHSGLGIPSFTKADFEYARSSFEQHIEQSVSVISIANPRYPNHLRVIKNPPPLLFLRGNPHILQKLPGVAVVGTRKASPAGVEIAKRVSRFLASSGYVVVSGLALGIDAAAHTGALSETQSTIAVLAGGVDSPSPKANLSIANSILETGGALISEHPNGTPPKKQNFVPRNRIQVGLSAASLIIESLEKSGTTTQAEFCVSQRRPLFVILPQSEENPLGLISEGPVMLVKNMGAIAIRSKSDYQKMLDIIESESESLTAL